PSPQQEPERALEPEVSAEAAADTEQPALEPQQASEQMAEAVIEEALEAVSEEEAESILAESITDRTADLRELESAKLKAVLEAIIYITDEPLTFQQICAALGRPPEDVRPILDELSADYAQVDRGLSIREIA